MDTLTIGRQLISDLQNELGVSPVAAQGIVGNLAHETDGFKDLQEKKPLVKGSKGGYGFAQWTGSRRDNFENWASQQGLDPSSYEANKGFLIHELTNTPEGKVLASLQNAQTPEEAALTFSNEFLRPGIPHNDKRIEYANKFAKGYEVELPDGRVLEFTGDESEETLNQIRQKIRDTYYQETPDMAQENVLEAPQNFFQRTGEALSKRAGNISETVEAQVNKEQTLPETAMQLAWEGVGTGGDILGNLAISGYRALPEIVKPPIKQAGQLLGKLPVAGTDETLGERLPKELGMLSQAYGDWAQEHPRAARNLRSSLGLLTTFSPIKGTKTLMKPVESTTKTLKTTGKTLQTLSKSKLLSKANKATLGKIPKPFKNMPLKDTADDALRLSQKYNVSLGIDDLIPEEQAAGLYMRAVKHGQKLPFSGGSNSAKQVKEWNAALAKTMGMEKVTRFTPKVMDDLFEQTSAMFDKLTKGKTFNITDDVLDNLSQMEEIVFSGQYGTDGEKLFKRYVDDVFSRVQDNSLSGDNLVKLRNKFSRLKRSGSNVDAQTLANDFEGFLVDMIGDDAPEALKKAKSQYKNLIVIEPLAAKAQADGLINPSSLNNRVSVVYKRAHTRGKSGDIGELARLGQHIKDTVKDSGTPGGQSIMRMGVEGAAALGSGAINPVLPLAYAAGKTAHILGNRALQNYNVNAARNLVTGGGGFIPSVVRTTGAGIEGAGNVLGSIYTPSMTRGAALGVLREQQ